MLEGLKNPVTTEELKTVVKNTIDIFNSLKSTEGSVMEQRRQESEIRTNFFIELVDFILNIDNPIYKLAFMNRILNTDNIKEGLLLRPEYLTLSSKLHPIVNDDTIIAEFKKFITENF